MHVRFRSLVIRVISFVADYFMRALFPDAAQISVHVSDIPYNQKFGSPNGRDESLGTYIDEIANHRLGDHPW